MDDSDTILGALVIGSNDDLLTEILIRLPVTSILRFKSVSKHWRLLDSQTLHSPLCNNNLSRSPLGFGNYDVYVPFDVEDPSPPPFRSLGFYFNRSGVKLYFNRSGVRIKQSCNGLLLCSVFYNNGALDYYVFNPTTKQLAFIPSLPKYARSMALAFHQTECVHFKVVCVCSLEPDRDLFQILVYSSDTGKWKICVESFYVQDPLFCQPVYLSGAVHWAPDYRNFLYFKLDVEQLQTLSLPEELTSNEISTVYFGESRGHLHLISETEREETSLIVYEMLMDHSGWFVKYRIQLDELLSAFPEMVNRYRYNFEVVDVVRGKEEEDTFLVLVTPFKVIRYNVHDKSFKELFSNYNCPINFLSFHRYIEALSSF